MAYTFKHGDRPLDEFTIQRAVGSGGFGEVYYAMSDGGREVALKYLKQNPDVELRGVSHCINLKSPHLVSIFDVKKNAEGEYFIIMEYCSGPSLRDMLIAEPDGLGPQKAAFFVREIAKGLAYLHDRGIVHRDMKPGNIFYDDGYVKICDYGLSKFIAVSRHSLQTASIGTVHYMAPEIGSGDYSRGVDIYALGVILYEMLLGKVPFEGSTMGEVLMKHLTTQPGVDGLPEPFGKVIHKALEKDPKDRYQTVDEMVDELLSVDTVQKSLAGFTTKSLDGAVRRGAADRAESPVPSPNPAPRNLADAGGPAGVGRGRPDRPPNLDAHVEFPRRLAKKIDRISRKLEKKVAKLGGRIPPPVPPRGVQGDAVGAHGAPPTPAEQSERKRRMLLSLLLASGLSVGLAVVVGVNVDEGAAGVGSAMLVFAMTGGILLSQRAVVWFGVTDGPKWARMFVKAGCCAPLMAVGAIPLMAELDGGAAVWLGMLVVAALARWEKALDHTRGGDINIWGALWTACGGAIATAIACGVLNVGDDETSQFMAIGAGVAGIVSVVLQSVSWWQRAPAGGPWRRAGSTAELGSPFPPVKQPPAPPLPDHTPGGHAPAYTRALEEADDAVNTANSLLDQHVDADPYRTRFGVTRAMWGLIAFLLMGGAIVAFVATQILCEDDVGYDGITRLILVCVACVAAMIFAVRKTTPIKREGFWQESLRPLLMSVALFGIGATITGIGRNWDWLNHPQQAGVITGLVISSILLLVSTAAPRHRPAAPQPFFNPCEDAAGCCGDDKTGKAGGEADAP